jgi:ATP-dependent helicase/DNAse subunit B
MALGTILHEALEHFYTETTPNKTKEEWLDFLDTHEARKKLSGFVQAALAHEKFKSEIPYRKRLVAESLTEILYTLLKKEKETERKRLTSPQFFELSFGSGHKNNPQSLPALQIDNPEGEPILIRGTIDRVDVDLQSKVALVIDYKRTKTFDISEIQQGIHLQLPLYVLVLRDLLGLEPAGAELYSLKKGQRSGLYVQELKEKLGKITSLKGSVSQEEFNRILEEAKTLVRQCVNRIREGEIQIDSKNCDLCSCDHICRFEKWKLAYKKETRDR